ncbi:MAG: zinc finger domain-containing protein, partial [Candidatus Eisenbacteria bacterium]
LSFTAEEIWQHAPALKGEAESVFEATWGDVPPADAADLADWSALAALRESVHGALEPERAAKRIVKTQEARVEIAAAGEAERALLARFARDLPAYLLVAEAGLDGPVPAAGEMWGVRVGKTACERCERCWNHRATVGAAPAHPTLCARCVAALPPGFARPEPAESPAP